MTMTPRVERGALLSVKQASGLISPLGRSVLAFERLRAEVEAMTPGGIPLRLAIMSTDGSRWACEVDYIDREASSHLDHVPSMFAFRQQSRTRTGAFNIAMLVPTGTDCVVGGHAGDAAPAARLLASICDHLVLHPNVVNASDINEQTDNSLYVEGSILGRLLMGSVALRKVRSNRILVLTEAREDGDWAVDQVVNSASAARAVLGADCTKVVILRGGLSMRMGQSPSGRSVGTIEGLEWVFNLLEAERGTYDAVAISSRVMPTGDTRELFERYFELEGGPNPWGGAEAVLTHAISTAFGVPSAHSPAIEELELRAYEYGRVDPRKAAEAISTSYLFSVLKGLHRAPACVTDIDGAWQPDGLSAEDVSCLIVPDGAVGLPTLAAAVQDIPVIAVRGNHSMMTCDLRCLPFRPRQLWYVENYLEAVGLAQAFKIGLAPESVLRPLLPTQVELDRA